MFTPFKVPKFLQWLYPALEWTVPATSNTVYLTFDDGPNANITPWVIEELEKINAKATFFCVGENAKNNPDLMNVLLKKGHSVGNHTYNHLKGWKTKDIDYINNIAKANELLSTSLFRPPYGRITKSQTALIKSMGFRIIMWSQLSCDYLKNLNRQKSLNSLLKNTKPGAVVVFHDSEKAAANLQWLLPKYLEAMHKLGFTFSAIK